MKRMFGWLFFLLVFTACNSGETYAPADDPMSAAMSFIDGCMKGKFKMADFYMLPDQENKIDLHKLEEAYDQKDRDMRQNYRMASIMIDHEEVVDAQTHIIYFKNSYDKQARKVKVLLKDGHWVVDLKYTFDGNL